jgi:hypothetical protein
MLSTQRLLEEPDQPEFRGEYGWQGVGRGLRRLLLAHLIMVGSIGLLVVLVIIFLPADIQQQPSNKIVWGEIILFGAVLLVALAVLISYGMLFTGQWLCLMYAPERRGTKWLMFSAMTCLVMTPALNITSCLLSDPQHTRARRETRAAIAVARGVRDYPHSLEENDMNAYLRIAGAGLGLLSSLLFILFLRSIAHCFEDRVRVLLVDLYLMFTAVVVGGTLYVALAGPDLTGDPTLVLALGVGWVLDFFYYLFLIGSMGRCAMNYRPPKPLERAPAEL